jgi:hypothetical protein
MKEDGLIRQEKSIIFPARTFSFDPKRFEFNIGNSASSKTFKLSEIKDIFDIDRSTFELKEEVKPNDQRKTLLMSTLCDLIELPALRSWLISLSQPENMLLCKKVESVMRDVYYRVAVFGGKPIERSARLKAGSIYSFSAAVRKNGTFHLTTPGEYSALGTGSDMQTGSVIYGSGASQKDAWGDPSLPIEHQLHNADRDNAEAKRLSLYAGAGTIVWLAANFPKPFNP